MALIGFAGDPPATGDGGSRTYEAATILASLTNDFARIEVALDALLREDPRGATDMAAGLERARAALDVPSSSPSGAERAKAVLLFTDGQPTLPHGPGREADNVREVLGAVRRTREAGIRIYSFAIGSEALEGPLAVVEMAHQTGGSFVPVRHPGDLVEIVSEVSLVRVREVGVFNRTTGEKAPLLRTRSDGAWGGFVPLDDGDNAIEVVVRTDDGTEARRTVMIRYLESGPPIEIPPSIALLHRSLQRDCLAALRHLNLELEGERRDRIRRELRLEIERERTRRVLELEAERQGARRQLRLEVERERVEAIGRAAAQRKHLELEVIEEEAGR